VDDSQSTSYQEIEAIAQWCTWALVLLVCIWIHFGLLSDIKRLGVFGFLALVLVVFVWMDFMSGVFHITLDNPNVNDWPGIGGPARDFQEHHFNPGFLTRKPWHTFLREVHVPAAGFCYFSLLRPRHRLLKVWYLLAILGAHAMMACHRFAHTAPSRVPAVVLWLQDKGIFVSATHHSKHHMTYDCNFSIVAGISDVVLNEVVKYVDRYSTIWAPILILYALAPILFVCIQDFCTWAFSSPKKVKTV
jgi:ubiquitin-conjugating enzyme E2 variant